MADCEDAQSPSWDLMLEGQLNLQRAVRRDLDFATPEGKAYKLKDASQLATLVVRPRGWHLSESHVLCDGEAMSGSLFDFGLYFYHNAKTLLLQGSGPYFYLPKLESHHEARLWAEVFAEAERYLDIPQGTIRATVLIETINAAFEMDEILFELRPYAAGLNAGRWDYIFSFIKRLGHQPTHILPDRSAITMTVPFMRAYTELLVQTCHRRNAHAMGGMSAFIPSRKDAELNARAIAAVRADKEREASDGFDGTWVAHPDLVPVACEIFDRVLGPQPHQKHVLRNDRTVAAEQLTAVGAMADEPPTPQGFRSNIKVALQYIGNWLNGSGAVGIDNLMEDAATAEISRTQLWQWLYHQVRLSDGSQVSPDYYRQICQEEIAKQPSTPHLNTAAALLDEVVLAGTCPEFMTSLAYKQLSH